ncbi:Aste57867_1102 [Aphanomyces stellatus]|uniref:Aste57867_1102 protein n=1 Tax=Aphanomyces stellatus TaxID=120398 RepID=A0A485K4J9_9STRA|nr:hypothetical protein As57867_001101 [Aphanomyces stellatus]VFT78323.1 Aste57867_1102 [Aphanomyces stellatus]
MWCLRLTLVDRARGARGGYTDISLPSFMGCGYSVESELLPPELLEATEVDPRDTFGTKLPSDPAIATLSTATTAAELIRTAPLSGAARCTDISHVHRKASSSFPPPAHDVVVDSRNEPEARPLHIVISGESVDDHGIVYYHLTVPGTTHELKKRFEDFQALHQELTHLAMKEEIDVVLPMDEQEASSPTDVAAVATPSFVQQVLQWPRRLSVAASGAMELKQSRRQQLQRLMDAAAEHPTTLTSNAYRHFVAVSL